MTSFMGKILHVDLSTGSAESIQIPSEVYEAVLAGKGLEAWYLYREIPAGADPLGPENILGFAPGALCGTGAFLTGRWTVACKSPLTGGWGDANCGGLFAPAIKQCGYDAIFVSGISEKPVYLFCDGKTVLYDAKPKLDKGVFRQLADLAFFMERCTIMNETLAWDLSGTGDETNCIDIDPDMLYHLEAVDDSNVA